MTPCDTAVAPSLAGACLSVRPPGRGTCRICCGAVPWPFVTCWSCRRVGRTLGQSLEEVTPISLTTRETGLYAALKQYKGVANSVSRRQQHRLAELVGDFLEGHAGCVAPGGYDVVTVIPSFQVHADAHPLEDTLRMVPQLAHQGVEVVASLLPAEDHLGRNTASLHAYSCVGEHVERRRVLLVDDLYTTGAHLHSAVAALQAAGASSVHPLVVGRHQSRDTQSSRELLRWSSCPENLWSSGRCARCSSDCPSGSS
ncbi:MAG TPA: hypothetical protein VMR97_05240 [Acidimicrobiales bacterium]|nr:hypothetical protein [Acidimicrobiales bacterium]